MSSAIETADLELERAAMALAAATLLADLELLREARRRHRAAARAYAVAERNVLQLVDLRPVDLIDLDKGDEHGA